MSRPRKLRKKPPKERGPDYRVALGRKRLRATASDVCVGAIPQLEGGYKVLGVDEVSIGGAAPKSFIRFGQGHSYIAKSPFREYTGYRECVTEHLISRIGRQLPLAVAESRLAHLGRDPGGRPDVRFLSRYFRRTGETLVHGVELVGFVFGMDREAINQEVQRTKEQDFYNVGFVEDVLRDAARRDKVLADRLVSSFIRMLAFDALVGAHDRHAENWGVLFDSTKGVPLRFAPIYDTAKGLFLERNDGVLQEHSAADPRFVETYADGARPLIGLPGRSNINHFELMGEVSRNPRHRPDVLRVVRSLDLVVLRRMMHREFGPLFSESRLHLIWKLLAHRHRRLMEICEQG